MTMALLPPTEEERRLLREYRLTSVPSRRPSCSPATSNASSSTNHIRDQQLQQPQITTSTPTSAPIIPAKQTTQLAGHFSPNSSAGDGIQRSGSAANSGINLQNQHTQHSHYHHHHHRHHHHHSSNHKGQKSATPTHELTADELSQMLELVSELSYLKLISPKSGCSSSFTTSASATNDKGVNENGDDRTVIFGNSSEINSQNSAKGPNKTQTTKVCYNKVFSKICLYSKATNASRPYIFEKVDYIKKIGIRRKAFKKLEKAKSQTSSFFY